MDARDIAHSLGFGAAPSDERDDSRHELTEALWKNRFRPKFNVEGPTPTGTTRIGKHIYRTDFYYVFDKSRPWQPRQIVDAFSEIYGRMEVQGMFHAPRINISYTIQDGQPAGDRRQRARAAQHDHPISIPAQPRGGVKFDALLARVENEERYDEAVGIDGDDSSLSRIMFTVTEYRIPTGAGACEDLGLGPRTLVDLAQVPDGLCGQACLAWLVASPGVRSGYTRSKDGNGRLARAAFRMAAYINKFQPMMVSDFNCGLTDLRIVIVEGRAHTLFITDASPGAQTAYLLLHRGHYYVVSSIDSLVRSTPGDRTRWCEACNTASKGAAHRCSGVCPSCGGAHSYSDAAGSKCHLCNFSFAYAECSAFHRCVRYRCDGCSLVLPFKRRDQHRCGEQWCFICGVPIRCELSPHRCFIAPLLAKRVSCDPEIWAYDIESTIDVDGTHRIAVAVVVRLITRETLVFRGESAFLAWLNSRRPATTLVAHNGSAYDAYLVLAASRRAGVDLPQKFISDGAKLPLITYRNVRLIDSMRHLKGSLESVAGMFGIAVRKGFFPYRFYSPSTQYWVGDVPPREMFDVPAERAEEFDAWWGAWPPGGYSIEDEVVRYCTLDCSILCEVLERYRASAIAVSGVDPLCSVTIASHALRVYRTFHMHSGALFPLLSSEEYSFVRRGLLGGRTDARAVLRRWEPGSGRYACHFDIRSHYPSVQRSAPLPIGAPWWADPVCGADACSAWLIGLGDDKCALVECDVQCPGRLFHPVLLERRGERLVAALDITHGVFTSPELLLALSHGYTVTRIKRALCSNTSRDAFASYIDLYYGLKNKHSKDGPEPNPGLASVAKLMLNSLWGKFGQRDRGEETRPYSTPDAWFRRVAELNSGALDSLVVHEVTPEYVLATSCRAADDDHRTSSALVAAFITAHARVRLYAALDQLGERVLYHDTDSVIFEKGDDNPPLGTGLGEWVDVEHSVPIIGFVALGPKTYAYKCLDGRTHVRSKGFASGFTFDQYWDMASAAMAGLTPAPLVQKALQFHRSSLCGDRPGTITTGVEHRHLMISHQKTVVISAARTLPWGHADCP